MLVKVSNKIKPNKTRLEIFIIDMQMQCMMFMREEPNFRSSLVVM